MSEFHEAIGCIGIEKSKIVYIDQKKVNARRPGQLGLGQPWRPREGKLSAKAAQGGRISCFKHLPLCRDSCVSQRPSGVDGSPGGNTH